MKKFAQSITLFFSAILLTGCAGIKYLTIETQEPAQVVLPKNIRSVLVVNNVVKQPHDMGHDIKKLGKKEVERTSIAADSIEVYYTEALAQFLGEEEYFDKVLYYHNPLRSDHDFWQEIPIMPDEMNRLKSENGVDAIVSLDKLIISTNKREHFRQESVTYADLSAKIQSTIRIYMPTLEGQIPTIQYVDSLRWEGYDMKESGIYADITLPSGAEAMKEMAIHAAEKMTAALSPHWQEQNRWLYTMQNKLMLDGAEYAEKTDWASAIAKWTQFYDSQNNKTNKAKAASNIALAYEMQGEMEQAKQWISLSYDLFSKSAAPGSLDMKRISLYKNEIERRSSNENKLDMQMP